MKGIVNTGIGIAILQEEDAVAGKVIELGSFNLDVWKKGSEVDIVMAVESHDYLGGGYYIIHDPRIGIATNIAMKFIDLIEEGEIH